MQSICVLSAQGRPQFTRIMLRGVLALLCCAVASGGNVHNDSAFCRAFPVMCPHLAKEPPIAKPTAAPTPTTAAPTTAPAVVVVRVSVLALLNR